MIKQPIIRRFVLTECQPRLINIKNCKVQIPPSREVQIRIAAQDRPCKCVTDFSCYSNMLIFTAVGIFPLHFTLKNSSGERRIYPSFFS